MIHLQEWALTFFAKMDGTMYFDNIDEFVNDENRIVCKVLFKFSSAAWFVFLAWNKSLSDKSFSGLLQVAEFDSITSLQLF